MSAFTCPRCGAQVTVTAWDYAEADRRAAVRFTRAYGRRWRARTEYVCQDCADALGEQDVLPLGEVAS